MTGLLGAFQEAWSEVRVHRSRVVLSLIGVVLAVFAMTIITAAGTIAQQVVLESGERAAGRTTTLQVQASSTDGTATQERTSAALSGLVRRFGVSYSSLVLQTQLQIATAAGSYMSVTFVEPDYGPIHRIEPVAGRWLVQADEQRLAPAAVVNTAALEAAGLAGTRPPFALPAGPDLTLTVVGVVDRNPYTPELIVLHSDVDEFALLGESTPTLELWVPPDQADAIILAVPDALRAQGMDGQAYATSDPELPGLISKARWGVRGLSLFALGLGALGVLNVGIVTVRQRIREIGVRRALGASSARVFAAVVLESVCATAIAGAVGVAAAVALVVNLPLDQLLQEADITEVPAFPVSAAVEAFVAAVAVGALAGLIPATIAVRSKVIDAIRY